jgi:hypothetical protein
MDAENDMLLLESNGWEIECESPFEIRTKDGSGFASGSVAYEILETLKYNLNNKNMKEKNSFDLKIFEAKKVLYGLLIKKCDMDRTENDEDLMYFLIKDVDLSDYFDSL